MIVRDQGASRTAAYKGTQVWVRNDDIARSGADYLPAFGRFAPYLERA